MEKACSRAACVGSNPGGLLPDPGFGSELPVPAQTYRLNTAPIIPPSGTRLAEKSNQSFAQTFAQGISQAQRKTNKGKRRIRVTAGSKYGTPSNVQIVDRVDAAICVDDSVTGVGRHPSRAHVVRAANNAALPIIRRPDQYS
jgi:hypothetical protein